MVLKSYLRPHSWRSVQSWKKRSPISLRNCGFDSMNSMTSSAVAGFSITWVNRGMTWFPFNRMNNKSSKENTQQAKPVSSTFKSARKRLFPIAALCWGFSKIADSDWNEFLGFLRLQWTASNWCLPVVWKIVASTLPPQVLFVHDTTDKVL